jgi:hypothetical protein
LSPFREALMEFRFTPEEEKFRREIRGTAG